jgi:collagenase-like PrtC family protease
VLPILPEIIKIGVRAIKVEGRQRSPTYVAQVTRTLRAALDSLREGSERFHVKPVWQAELPKVSEGSQATLGTYNRPSRCRGTAYETRPRPPALVLAQGRSHGVLRRNGA